MNDDIIRFLDLKDANIESVSSVIRKGRRIVTLQKKLMVTYCPICSHRMYSKGIYMKRNGRGYQNFSHLRNRFLFSQRENAAILGVPKPL